MTKIARILAVIIICCMHFLLFGCGRKILQINDFDKYADMTRETDKIEVSFDNYSGNPFCFAIEEPNDIAEIMTILFSLTYENVGSGLSAGDNTSIQIIQGNKRYTLSLNVIKENGNYYKASSTALSAKIRTLAEKAGAFDFVE